MDISEEEPETLEEIDPHWRAKGWLQVAVQGNKDEEVPWHKLLTMLTSGAEGMARSLAKHLVTVWQWIIKVRGEGMCPPTPYILNIGQFIMDEKVVGMHGRATLVHGLLPHAAAGGQGSLQKKMEVKEGSPRD